MADNSKIRIAVISDLHATGADGAECDTHLIVSKPSHPVDHHPVESLLELIEKKNLSSDLLLCAGDIANKADPAGIQYAWDKIHIIGNALGAKSTLATTGNHDLDSRYQENDFDPKGYLQALKPLYPSPEQALTDKYWGRNYAIIDINDCRILLLNSCAYHGGDNVELNRGRVSSLTLESIKYDLASLDEKLLNICLTHHGSPGQRTIVSNIDPR